MARDGTLGAFYDEYVRISGERDAFLGRLISCLGAKSAEEQRRYLEAIYNPDELAWPDDAPRRTPGERLESLRAIGVIPMKKDVLSDLSGRYVLPGRLLDPLRRTASYARGAERIEEFRAKNMLIPRGPGVDPAQYENLSEGEYEREVRLRHLGHTPAMIERLDFLTGEIQSLAPPLEYARSSIFFGTIDRLKALRNQKVTHRDFLFIVNAARLFERRREIKGRRAARYAAGISSGGAVFGVALMLAGDSGHFFWGMLFFLIVTAQIIAFGIFAEWQFDKFVDSFGTITGVFFGVFLFELRTALIPFFVFVPLIGAISGSEVAYGLERYALYKNRKLILEACESYSAPPPEAAWGGVDGPRGDPS
jgi:hypothetical protein